MVVEDFLYLADTSLLVRGKVKKIFIPQEMKIVLIRPHPWISEANPLAFGSMGMKKPNIAARLPIVIGTDGQTGNGGLFIPC